MAGRIKADDVALVKERSSIEDVVREHVTLRSAGPGSLKGLCPFHDEKSPSFNIRPAVGAWHCFGCGEGGDVISFVQKVEHLSFSEAVERLAGKLGMELHYEDGGGPRRDEGLGKRSRLVEAHRVAAEFYAGSLVDLAEARAGRDFLRDRGFDRTAAEHFGVGFSPRAGEALTRHLRAKGFSDDEIVTAGLAGRGQRGLYDRFRGRLMWPIRDITGDVVGFGARRLFDDDRIEAKYLNTAETSIYKKSTVLYGLDLAKKAISRDRTAVVVEGYTDVMACHLAGIETAVATCGTAFGVDHIKVLRRLMRDESDLAPAKVVFTFDGDAAGQKAAMRAFADDQRWASQSFVAVESSGKDPCELRQSGGDLAVRALIEDALPMFEFAVRTTLARFDLANAEGRIQGLRAVAPIIAGIRDRSLRPEYTRTVAGWIGVEVEQVAAEVGRAGRIAARDAASGGGVPGRGTDGAGHGPNGGAGRGEPEHDRRDEAQVMPHPDLRDPVVLAERQLLQAVLQFPGQFDATELEAIDPVAFTAPAHRAVHDAIRAAGGPGAAASTGVWADRVTEAAAATVRPLVSELAVAPLPTRIDGATGLPERRYLNSLLVRVQEVALTRRIADALSALRRMESGDPEAARALSVQLQGLQRELVALRDRLG
ncbi:DNA primase [Oryzihumus leptocrescens]|uniref:DNA primase n=1 Tax=Oryzihumus leptocrescens TaxID=297536 RepID=A0A542ZHS9_9MICO|nr:DNA primase [Oryzihumus leptocrescens]TQL59859.1 DNA primase [Oryzihumus leptocrescens]